uniref:Protein MgtC n=1 Tax=Coralloluteibacterium stylophorae TaxID=1776034 RepID=A0A8J8AYZ5_9GAMM
MSFSTLQEQFAPLLWPVLGSLVAGILIGLEREYKGRPAGLRTHTMVCLASSLLMFAATRQAEWDIHLVPGESIVTDPTRMAHGVLTGIGFLCAGVIFREGFSIRGLTTATSLWMTASLGLLFGVGMHAPAVLGTAAALVVLAGFRLAYAVLPRRETAEVEVRVDRVAALVAHGLKALLDAAGFDAAAVRQRCDREGRTFELRVQVRRRGRVDTDAVGRALHAAPEVRAYDVQARED